METSPGDEAESKAVFQVDKQICRCCLTTEKHMKSSADVQQYFMELSGINVAVSDGMPQWVCVECSALMQKAIAFKHKMLRAHSVLNEYLMKCAPKTIDLASPELTRYKTPHLSTTQTLNFDSLQENIGYHEVLQQEKQILKSELNQVPLLPMFETPQTAFESVEAAFSDFDDDPLEYQYGNTEEEDLEEENSEEEEDEEDLEEESEEDAEEDENTEDDDDSEENEDSEPEVKRIKSDKEPPSTKTEKFSVIQPPSKITTDLAWTSDNTKILIDFVKRNEALYNPKNELYKIAVLKQKLWRDVAATLNKSDIDCCRRWCYVRDYYIRRRGKAGGGEAAKKRAHLLSFLDSVPSSQRSWVPAESSREEDQEDVKKETVSSDPDPWEGIRIGEQFSKMSPNVWNGETDDVLIDFVKRNEVLYNPRNKNFRKVHMKQKLWREIGTVLHKTDSECYKRWCYVRDYYIRRKANPGALSTGKAAKRRADKLSFLDNDTAHRPGQSHNTSEKELLKSERKGQLSTETLGTALDSVKAALSDFGPGQLRISERYSKKTSNSSWTGDSDDALIDFVSRHEALYNPRSKDFRRTALKQQLWIDIGNKLNRTDTDCCRRWCYVRDYYIRRRGKAGVLSTGKAAKRRADKLSFLDSVPPPRPGQSLEKEALKSEHSDASQNAAEGATALESIQAKFSDLARGRLDEFRVGKQESYSKLCTNVCWTGEYDEILIDFVKRNEELYDPKSRKVELKQKLWSDLGSTLGKSESDCYKRWCYVRDYYIRRRGKAGGGEAATRRAHLLSFLDNVPSPQRTSSSSAHKYRS